MKNHNNTLKSGVYILLTALLFISCTDKNDWDVDSSYDRLFSVTKLSTSIEAADVKISWTVSNKAEYYIIEVSKDSLYDDIAMGEHSSSIIYGEDKSITKSPFTVTLNSETKYYLRAKAMSSSKDDSKWAYLSDYYFTTKSEQIITATIIGSTYITINWTGGLAVTHAELLDASGTFIRTIDFDDDIIEAGAVTIDELEASTAYTVNIYNGEAKRGYKSFNTGVSLPEGYDETVILAATDSLNQTLFDELAAREFNSVLIALSPEATYYNSNSITLPDNMSFEFFGIAGAKKPIIGIKQLNLNNTHARIKFQNVEISGKYPNENGVSIQSDYLINQSNATNVNTIEFINCFVHDFKNSPLRLQGSAVKTIAQLTVDNCIFYGATSRTYSLIHVDASKVGKIDKISFSNSTIWYTGKSFIYAKETDFTSVAIENCTFSKAPGTGDYILDAGNTTTGPNTISLKNVIFGSMGGTSVKGIRSKATVSVDNCYRTSDWVSGSNHISGLSEYSDSETTLFTDPENGDFTIKDSNFSEKRSCGDPRWYMPQ
ncbi:DUF5123 domain-containing protein [Bacteroides sp. 224]|uniref:DUF5123 domain-containing protein n=1 Tax=Bacteroides sp. 224 TaxID=2302936 RepID=UPI0013D7603C|nr:DUF5123 domain-containing protein [Bacteroides sp. 224]NDV66128.1 DUF5123 domain-containing protein [Bacteroides sp. 224]